MTAADVEEVVDLAQLPDLDNDVPCEMLSYVGDEVNCQKPARWLRLYTCCGGRRTYCTSHMLRVIHEVGAVPEAFICHFCRTSPMTVGSWREL